MEIKEVNNKENWESFLLKCNEKTFLDSWNWGEFQKKEGERIWRFGIYDNEQLISVALVIKVKARRGTFLFVPHGPNIINPKSQIPNPKQITWTQKGLPGGLHPKSQILNTLLIKLKEIAKEEKAHFIRIAPIWEKNEDNIKVFRDLGFIPAPIHMHAEATWNLDIKPSEEDLLMNMRKTTRYLIKQAQRNNDIQIFQSQKVEDINIFNKIHQEVVKKHHFIPFSLDYLKNEFSAFTQDNQISLFFGKYKEEIIASAFVLFCSNIGFYHHAALSPKYNKIPIAYLLQWEAIQEAKRRGCILYDFWGYVSPKEQPHHPWAGPTLFKMGFGGYKKEYVKTQDLPLSWKYWLTFVIEKIRKIKRGL